MEGTEGGPSTSGREQLMQSLSESVDTAEALEAAGKYREAAQLTAQSLTAAWNGVVQTQGALPTMAQPPKMPLPRKSYVERYKRRVRVDWEKWNRESRREVPLPAGKGSWEDEDEEGEEEESNTLDDPIEEGDDADPGQAGSNDANGGTRHHSSSWQPKATVKNLISVPGSPDQVELVHTCANGVRVATTLVVPDIPMRANHMFNADAKGTIKSLFEGDKDLCSRTFSYDELASWLLSSEKISKLKLGDYLGRSDAHAIGCITAALNLLDFKSLTLDEALRFFLSLFRLPGEAQQIDRVMESFAKRYTKCHPNVFKSADTAYVLAFSVIMLNTDAHSPQVTNKMTQEEFIRNNRGIGENDTDLPSELLIQLYQSIVKNEIKLEQREFISSVQEGWLYKQGGRIKTWKKRYTILSGNVLYYFKTPKDISPAGFIPLENVQVIRHDRTLTFELKSADGGREMKSVHMAKEKGKQPTRFESGHHKSFVFRTQGIASLDDWIAAVQEHAVAVEIPQGSNASIKRGSTPNIKTAFDAGSTKALTCSAPEAAAPTVLKGQPSIRNNVNTYRT